MCYHVGSVKVRLGGLPTIPHSNSILYERLNTLCKPRMPKSKQLFMYYICWVSLIIRLNWTELDWAGLGWAGLGWTGLDWAGLNWTGLDCQIRHKQVNKQLETKLPTKVQFTVWRLTQVIHLTDHFGTTVQSSSVQ